MTSRIPYSDRERLERAYTKSEPAQLAMPRLTSVLRPIWHRVVSVLTPLDEPRIRQVCGADGSVNFLAYDPITGDRQLFASEEMLRVWLSGRYRQ